jgi:DNA-binding transcriptional LysR family regulator
MDSLALNVFVQAAETRSFVAAGRILGISASGIGKSVSLLEESLGVRLFHRSTRSVTLTAEGEMFLERARRILGEFDAAEAELSQASTVPKDGCASDYHWLGTPSFRHSPSFRGAILRSNSMLNSTIGRSM